ncbi:hypothetical protein [Azospirillum argentinense]
MTQGQKQIGGGVVPPRGAIARLRRQAAPSAPASLHRFCERIRGFSPL